MEFCKNCGAGLEPGRFCTNCGAPVDAPASTQRGEEESAVEKTAIRMPAVQPDASTGTRYPLYAAPPPQQPTQQAPPPLFADEVPTRAPEQGAHRAPSGWAYGAAGSGSAYGATGSGPQSGAGPTGPAYGAPQPGPAYDASIPPWQPPEEPADVGGSHRSDDDRKRSPLFWLLPLLLVVVIGVGIGVWLGSRDEDSSADAKATDDQSQAQDPSEKPSSVEPSEPGPADPPSDAADAEDITTAAKPSGPAPIKPGRDLANNKVTYPPSNMLDGDPTTAYRMPGDASGSTITFTLPEETTIHEVGLINGYAKTDTAGGRTVDWYSKNRRITEVEWSFDDGTTVTQKLRKSTDLQVIMVDAAVTRTVTLRLVSVSAPGKGDLSKNVTAISSVMLRGSSN